MKEWIDLKNIPISISILHEQEYRNLCNMFHTKPNIKRRAYTAKRALDISIQQITISSNQPVANIRRFHLEADV